MPLVTADGGLTLDKYELWVDDGLQGDYTQYVPSALNFTEFVPDTGEESTDTASEKLTLTRREAVVSGLTQGRVYRLKYRVKNAVGYSDFSPVASMLVAGPPAPPAEPEMVSVDASSITLRFQEVTDNGGSPTLRYELHARPAATPTFSQITAYDGQSMTFTLEAVRDGLVPGSIHYFKMLAVNDVGNSLFSEEASFALAPLPPQLSPAPILVQAQSNISGASLLIQWTGAPAIAPAAGEIAVTGYRLYMDGGNDGYY
jgi:hypothetical protein